jgi:uncharacterized protein YlxW (UPF0749 family)
VTAAPTSRNWIELVLNPQDPAYRDAYEARRAQGDPPRWYDRPATVLGALLIGFTLAVAYVHTHRGAPQAQRVHADLVTRVRAAQGQADDLQQRVADLGKQITDARDRGLAGDSALTEQLRAELVAAGEVAVQGPGLRVRLRDATTNNTDPLGDGQRAGTTPLAATHRLTDRDVRSVVNELWTDGAEAITVNDIRLTPTSAIRFAGEVVLVDFEPIASPYVINAIGDEADLATGFAASAVASRYTTQVSANGIGFSFAEHKNLALPAAAPVSLRYATVGGTK